MSKVKNITKSSERYNITRFNKELKQKSISIIQNEIESGKESFIDKLPMKQLKINYD